jgi:hypothetical protein
LRDVCDLIPVGVESIGIIRDARLDARSIGVRLGVIIQGKLDEKVFYQISYWALLGIGVKQVYDGAAGILR